MLLLDYLLAIVGSIVLCGLVVGLAIFVDWRQKGR